MTRAQFDRALTQRSAGDEDGIRPRSLPSFREWGGSRVFSGSGADFSFAARGDAGDDEGGGNGHSRVGVVLGQRRGRRRQLTQRFRRGVADNQSSVRVLTTRAAVFHVEPNPQPPGATSAGTPYEIALAQTRQGGLDAALTEASEHCEVGVVAGWAFVNAGADNLLDQIQVGHRSDAGRDS